jgi:hypothetical protein
MKGVEASVIPLSVKSAAHPFAGSSLTATLLRAATIIYENLSKA